MLIKGSRFPNIVIFAVILCLLFIIGFQFTHQYAFHGLKGFIFYKLLPISLLLFLIVSLRLNQEFKAKLSLVLISSTLTVYSINTVLIFSSVDAHVQFLRFAKKSGVQIDTRTKFEVIEDLKTLSESRRVSNIYFANIYDALGKKEKTLEKMGFLKPYKRIVLRCSMIIVVYESKSYCRACRSGR